MILGDDDGGGDGADGGGDGGGDDGGGQSVEMIIGESIYDSHYTYTYYLILKGITSLGSLILVLR